MFYGGKPFPDKDKELLTTTRQETETFDRSTYLRPSCFTFYLYVSASSLETNPDICLKVKDLFIVVEVNYIHCS